MFSLYGAGYAQPAIQMITADSEGWDLCGRLRGPGVITCGLRGLLLQLHVAHADLPCTTRTPTSACHG